MHLLRTTALVAVLAAVVALAPFQAAVAGPDGKVIAGKSDCFGCHSIAQHDAKKMGPNYGDIAIKYAGNKKAVDMLAATIKKGGSGHWGSMQMPPHPTMSDADAKTVATWIMALNKGAKPAGKPVKPAKKKA